MAQIELKDIEKIYRVGENVINAVKGVNLEINEGEFVSIVGHSGSGKTTLLSILGGILSPSGGNYRFEGMDVYSQSKNRLAEYRAESVGYVFQFASLLPVLSAKENLLLPVVFSKKKVDAEAEKKAVDFLGLVGLSDKVDSFPGQLSGGQQRRVAIARSLMNDPRVLLADEPTGDLDEETEAEVMRIFEKINREEGITFVLVTHSSELASGADRRLHMSQGEFVESL